MRIVYIANHGQKNSNDDEGAIQYALESLGHEVVLIRDRKGSKSLKEYGDFALFHKWEHTLTMDKLNMPKVFWYFDLVQNRDPTTAGRDKTRMAWMENVLPHVGLGFCTDGDWVAKDTTGKLHVLRQGADERILGRSQASTSKPIPIMFSGIRRGGANREDFVDFMSRSYRHHFRQVQDCYREQLADKIAHSRVVVAPDAPATDHYWSNRVYLTLGFGGFLIHPYCAELAKEYEEDREIVFYRNRSDLKEKINKYLWEPAERIRIRQAGLARTASEHTYTHRCKALVSKVQELLL